MSAAATTDTVRAWRPSVPGVREVLHAHYVSHTYPPHTHDTWTMFIVDEGAIRYQLGHHQRGCDRPAVGILPPFVTHDGRAAGSGGYYKRVLYLDADVIGEHFIGHAVDHPEIVDRALRQQLAAVHRLIEHRDDGLECESRFAFVVEAIRAHLGERPSVQPWPPGDHLADALRSLLDEHPTRAPTLASAGTRLGVTPTHLVRCFSKTYGIPPHAYLLGRRIDAARRRLLDGEPLADVAVAVGFYDQAHFTRHFRRYLGTTPRRYAQFTGDASCSASTKRVGGRTSGCAVGER